MANFKFFNIVKANAEIDRLSAELSSAQEKISSLAANEPELLAALQGEITKLKDENSTLSSRLSAAESLASQVAQLQKLVEDTEASVEQRAAEKALAITQAQGQPSPVAVQGGVPFDAVAAYMAEQDPTQRAKLYRQHKDKIIAAAFRK